MTDSNYTFLALVVDRSGSMYDIQKDAQGAVNNFIRDQQALPGRATLTLAQFDTEYELVHENVDLQEVGEYTLSPRGGTALLDAWGKTVTSVGEYLAGLPEDQRPGTVVVVVVTDGEENSSVDWTLDKVKSLTQQQTDQYGWKFIFLAANQDAIQAGSHFGVAAGSSLTYGANALGTQAAFAGASGLVTQYRGGNTDAVFDSDVREEALGK